MEVVLRGAGGAAPKLAKFLDEDLEISVKLKKARLDRGKRLSDVALASGCSQSLISKIENGKATPSLNTLHRIAKALGTTIVGLLSDGTSFSGIVTRQGERPILSRMGLGGAEIDGAETELLIPLGATSPLQATLLRVFPGCRSDGLRQHEGDEVGYVVAGQVLLTVGHERYYLRAGDSFFFSSTRPHGVENSGKQVAEIVWVNTPPSL